MRNAQCHMTCAHLRGWADATTVRALELRGRRRTETEPFRPPDIPTQAWTRAHAQQHAYKLAPGCPRPSSVLPTIPHPKHRMQHVRIPTPHMPPTPHKRHPQRTTDPRSQPRHHQHHATPCHATPNTHGSSTNTDRRPDCRWADVDQEARAGSGERHAYHDQAAACIISADVRGLAVLGLYNARRLRCAHQGRIS